MRNGEKILMSEVSEDGFFSFINPAGEVNALEIEIKQSKILILLKILNLI